MPGRESDYFGDSGDVPAAPGLTQADIVRLAHEQTFRAVRDTDEHGAPREGIEHSDDAAAVSGLMSVAEARHRPPDDTWHDFGADDTDDFRRAQLDGGVYNYDD